ncbi:hypothetical protein ABBQ38_013364 [Trebouxia sp. C0009 RCD-2024]
MTTTFGGKTCRSQGGRGPGDSVEGGRMLVRQGELGAKIVGLPRAGGLSGEGLAHHELEQRAGSSRRSFQKELQDQRLETGLAHSCCKALARPRTTQAQEQAAQARATKLGSSSFRRHTAGVRQSASTQPAVAASVNRGSSFGAVSHASKLNSSHCPLRSTQAAAASLG